MKTATFKVTIHMVSSLDGFIARKDNTVSWLESHDNYEKGLVLSEDEVASFLKSIDCYIMGSRTYAHALSLGWPYGDVPVVVLTHRKLAAVNENVKFYSGNLTELINNHLKPNYSTIWLVGGASAVKDFLRLELANEIIISIMPIVLGDGTLFFDYIGKEQRLHLKDTKVYKDGMVELTYSVLNEHTNL